MERQPTRVGEGVDSAGREPAIHRWGDRASGWVLIGLVVFTPWALGTTVPWAVGILNLAGLLLASLLTVKWVCRRVTGFERPVWAGQWPTWPSRSLAVVNVLVLSWCAISALNARSDWQPESASWLARSSFVAWLPHSVDARSSWETFWLYSGLSGVFWAARDWLMGLTPAERNLVAGWREERSKRSSSKSARFSGKPLAWCLPARLRRLMWWICLNGGLVALVASIQWFQGTDKLLWMFENPRGPLAGFGFGPFPYRNNGGEWANLIWPVCLGFWWVLGGDERAARRSAPRFERLRHAWLLLAAVAMAASPVVTVSRGGSIIAAGLVLGSLWVLTRTGHRRRRGVVVVWLVVGIAVAVGGWLGWPALQKRLFPAYHEVRETGRTDLGDLTIRCVFRVNSPVQTYSEALVGLSDDPRLHVGRPWASYVGLNRSGGLSVILRDPDLKPLMVINEPGITTNFAGGLLEVVLTRGQQEWALYVNGVKTGRPTRDPVRMSGIPERLPARALWISGMAEGTTFANGTIIRVSLLDRCLSEAELAARRPAGLRDQAYAEVAANDSWRDLSPVFDEPVFRFNLARWWDQMVGARESLRGFARSLMAGHSPVFGSGPGTYGVLLAAGNSPLPELADHQVHDDWLQTRLTFGWAGFIPHLVALALLLFPLAVPSMIRLPRILRLQMLLAMGGVLVHARFDFPFQTPSILFVLAIFFAVVAAFTGWPEAGMGGRDGGREAGISPEPPGDADRQTRVRPEGNEFREAEDCREAPGVDKGGRDVY